MVSLQDFKSISEYEWELPRDTRADMRVPVRVFATRELLEQALKDRSIEQAINASTLPGLLGWVSVMPDVHQGYGFPIGGVAIADNETGVVSPGGIGYDINCGVRLMGSRIEAERVSDKLDNLINVLYHIIPSGLGEKGGIRLSDSELDDVCTQGSAWAVKKGYAEYSDVDRTEDQGCLKGADPAAVSQRAKERGRSQLGTLGSGNHFLEVDLVDQVFDQEAAGIMGLHQGCLAVQIHSGSRGFGHQVCTDYVSSLQRATAKYRISIPDRELVCAPIQSDEGQAYIKAMKCAANFAFANRQLMLRGVREAFESVLATTIEHWHLTQVYDITHNIGKFEMHRVEGKMLLVCVHRKGATRCFGPGSEGLPSVYLNIGQPVLVPGSMGTASWVLRGLEGSMVKSFGSCAHGAGRVLSRVQAKKQVWGEDLRRDLSNMGITVKAGSMSGLAEEAPLAYKNVDEVITCVKGAGLAEPVARLVPLAVAKG